MKNKQTFLSIFGEDRHDTTVPVGILIRTLDGMQQLGLLLAAAQENQEFVHRFRPSEQQRQRFRLRCGVPIAGSFSMPIEYVCEDRQLNILTQDIMPMVFDLFEAAAQDKEKMVRKLIPDSRYRNRALQTMKKFCPKSGENWSVGLSENDGKKVSLGNKVNTTIDKWIRAGVEQQAIMTVTGELIRINFDEYKLFIRYPVTKRQLECSYLSDLEVDLLESRRDLIQVTGEFTLDAEGQPIRLTNVMSIEPVDLSPITFEVFEWNGQRLSADPPLRIQPHLDEDTQQLFIVEDPSLDLYEFAPTRDQLVDELSRHIVGLWNAYGNESPEKLTKQAQILREYLLLRFKEA